MKALSSQGIFSGALINVGSRSLARLLRLLLLFIISLKFGAGYETDAYFISQTILLSFLFLGDSVLNFSFIPVFVEYRKKTSEIETWQIANTTFTIISGILLLISLLLFFFAPYVAKILAPGFTQKALDLTTLLIRIVSPIPLFAGLAAVPIAVFVSYRSFIQPAVTALFYSIGTILFTLVLADTFGILAVPIGAVIGVGLQALVLILIIKQKGAKFGLSFTVTSGVKQVAKLSGPRLLSFTLSRVNLIIDRIFASGLGVGNVSYLTYAFRLFQIPSAILISALGRSLMPVLSEHAAANQEQEIAKIVTKSICIVAFVTVPLSMILFILRVPLIQLLFQRGVFDATSTQFTSTAFLFYDIGMVAFCMNIVLLGVFYALQNAVTPLKIAVMNAILNVIFDIALIPLLGIGGIALATSLIAILNTVLLLVLLQKRLANLMGFETVTSILKICLAAGVMAIVIWYIPYHFKTLFKFKNQILELGTFLFIGLATYSVACTLLNVNEFRRVLNLLRRKL